MGASHYETKTVKTGHHNKIVKTDIWGEFDAILEEETIRPDEITVNMFVGKNKVTRSKAEYFLKKQERLGKLKSRMVVYEGKVARVYSKV